MFTEFKLFYSDLTMTQQKKSHNFCSVFGCNSRYSTCEGINFHQFPKDNEIKIMWLNKFGVEELVDKRRIWAINLRMDKKTLQKKRLQICSRHFTEDNYFCPRLVQ